MLTIEQKQKILREVSLGVDPPDNEPDEARQYRELMEKQVEDHRDHGMMNVIPWNG